MVNVGITGGHLLIGKIAQIVIMWKVFNLRMGAKMKFTQKVITYIAIMTAQIMFVFVRIVVYLLDVSSGQRTGCTIMAYIDAVLSLLLSPLMMYAFMTFVLTFALKPEETV
ncbi:Transmembrane_domain-containing protein [Hexamita inflata]|nr:Transmembrane domain-containing protein [Hexamita inflata]CAI9917077.1 Transmembrane domain-containing protein [Hexamita inflata]CAI9964220.1 Transmembrane domain-containing protein [Hexamita inflata]